MQKFLSESDCKWLEETFAKFDIKIEKECERLGDKIPYIPQNGHYAVSYTHLTLPTTPYV